MLQCENYLQQLIPSLQHTFGNRLLYVGLQGSYLRIAGILPLESTGNMPPFAQHKGLFWMSFKAGTCTFSEQELFVSPSRNY